jgi:exportin-7
MQEQR